MYLQLVLLLLPSHVCGGMVCAGTTTTTTLGCSSSTCYTARTASKLSLCACWTPTPCQRMAQWH
jgi:hypothetical protein